jgi:hypothetical protein
MSRLLVLALLVALAAPLAAGARTSALVGYSRTGGFIGVHDSLTVLWDGTAVSSRGSFRITAQRLRTLRATLERARFGTLQRRYSADYPVADGFTYRVSYAGRSVVVEEEARVPLRLQRALDLLADLFGRRR